MQQTLIVRGQSLHSILKIMFFILLSNHFRLSNLIKCYRAKKHDSNHILSVSVCIPSCSKVTITPFWHYKFLPVLTTIIFYFVRKSFLTFKFNFTCRTKKTDYNDILPVSVRLVVQKL